MFGFAEEGEEGRVGPGGVGEEGGPAVIITRWATVVHFCVDGTKYN